MLRPSAFRRTAAGSFQPNYIGEPRLRLPWPYLRFIWLASRPHDSCFPESRRSSDYVTENGFAYVPAYVRPFGARFARHVCSKSKVSIPAASTDQLLCQRVTLADRWCHNPRSSEGFASCASAARRDSFEPRPANTGLLRPRNWLPSGCPPRLRPCQGQRGQRPRLLFDLATPRCCSPRPVCDLRIREGFG